MNKHQFYLSFLLLIQLLFISCNRYIYSDKIAIKDGKYDSEFPILNASGELERISRSVRKIIATAYYVNYFFDPSDSLTIEDIEKIDFSSQPSSKIYYTNSASGTATLISKNNTKFLFLTCAHILDFPDTLVYYIPSVSGKTGTIISNIAIKVRQSNFIPEIGDLSVLASDSKLDIALVGFTLQRQFSISSTPLLENIRPINVPLGNADELNWGNFIYLIGFPKGIKMVTRAIISKPDQGSQNRILTDALFNPGSSGGIALAIRDGIPNFELVGIASSVSAEDETYLTPEPNQIWDPTASYKGDIFVRRKRIINYGVTFIVPINDIADFVMDNELKLINDGYNIVDFKQLIEKIDNPK